MIKFGIKSAVLGSAVYYTIDKGVWKDSTTTSALYDSLEESVSPYIGEVKNYIPYQLPPLPSNDKITYLFKHYWNCGVKSTFQFLVDLPTHTNDAAGKMYDMVFSTLEAEDQSQQSKQSSHESK